MADVILDLLEQNQANDTPSGIGPVKFDVTGVSAVDPDNPCRYTVTITADVDTANAFNVRFNAVIDNSLFTLVPIVTTPPTNPTIGDVVDQTTNSFVWAMNPPPADDLPQGIQTLQFQVDYILDQPLGNVCPFLPSPDTFYSVTNPGGQTQEHVMSSCGFAVAACAAGIPEGCCDCMCVDTQDVEFGTCEDQKAQDINVRVAPEGKVLSVNLQFPSVCPNRELAVLVILTELIGEGEDQTENPVAHRVIIKPRSNAGTDCQSVPGCANILFAIKPSECSCEDGATNLCCTTCGEARIFRIKTVAHYLDTTSITVCECCPPSDVAE